MYNPVSQTNKMKNSDWAHNVIFRLLGHPGSGEMQSHRKQKHVVHFPIFQVAWTPYNTHLFVTQDTTNTLLKLMTRK